MEIENDVPVPPVLVRRKKCAVRLMNIATHRVIGIGIKHRLAEAAQLANRYGTRLMNSIVVFPTLQKNTYGHVF
jgi:hypothetical protein